jgi:hypothetical protein
LLDNIFLLGLSQPDGKRPLFDAIRPALSVLKSRHSVGRDAGKVVGRIVNLHCERGIDKAQDQAPAH